MSGELPVAGALSAGLAGGPAVGSRVGGYRLEELIGRGGMAVVFRALDERLDRRVALKVLGPELAADAVFRQRFIRESRAAAAVDDPNILPVFEAGEAGGVLFIAMRLVQGGDVRSLLAAQGPLPVLRAGWIVSAVASALDAAHGHGLVHRDVRPANMLLDARAGRPNHVYLSDFGLSKPWQRSTGLTGTGMFAGTVDYAAPEQIEGAEVDGRTDQYALGCAAFELLAGAPPFRRDQHLAVMHVQVSAPPPALTQQRPGLAASVDQVFARVLAKSAGDRYASCGEFAGALRSALGLPAYDAGSQDTPPQGQLTTVIAPRSPAVPGGPGPGVGAPQGPGRRPTGTITMLFSDIEGSTRLLSRLGDRYGEALSAQRDLVRAAISACRGQEMGTEGDSFFVVFDSAGDAVRCCVAAQRALCSYDWPGGAAVRVRMGLHSGEPIRHEDGYIGLDVHRAARIAAAAHGGQVVLSDATRLLVESQLPADVSVRDLGFHRLKDIEAPERIYQLAASGLLERFSPLKSLGAPTSLPVPLTPLVGRDSDLKQLCAVVARPGVRLVTLTGPGGVGKTRLALAAAASSLYEAFPHGVFFVALAAVRDAGVMWKTIADSLDASGDKPAPEVVTGHLSDRQALLVLDNLEQLDGAAGVVAALLAAAPRLVVLATSRRPLHVQGERELPVPPLTLPRSSGAEEVMASGAARLFAQQADLVRPGFALTPANAAEVAAICARLDGLPLAIELAASRVKLLTPRALLARLGDSLGLAAADAGRPSRQQTLRHTIGWSYDLLAPELAEVFRRMAVFAGGCDLEALAAVAVGDGGTAAGRDPLQLATELLDVSLITVTAATDGEPRLAMLETIRDYALERLAEAGELDQTGHRHAGYYAAFTERAHEQLGGPAQLATLDRLEAEHGNLLAALSWSLETRAADPASDERVSIGLRLVQALGPFWYEHGHATEGRRWLQRAIDLTTDDARAPQARLAHWLGMLLVQQDELGAAVRLFEHSLAIWTGLGDLSQQVRELNSLGGARCQLGDLDTARSLLEDSATISRKTGNQEGLARALGNLGQVEIVAGNLDRAALLLQEALELNRKREDLMRVAHMQHLLALNSLLAGRAGEARDRQSSTVAYVAGSGDTEFLIDALELSAAIAAELGDCQQAARLTGAAQTTRLKAGMPASQPDAAILEHLLAPARSAMAPEDWDAELAVGRALTHQQAVALFTQAGPST